uniref:Uncharacterized protein n=1 Tax=Anguilla anguilla TaxID=7936 RepID=A0A0E9TIX8_ANGAN
MNKKSTKTTREEEKGKEERKTT